MTAKNHMQQFSHNYLTSAMQLDLAVTGGMA